MDVDPGPNVRRLLLHLFQLSQHLFRVAPQPLQRCGVRSRREAAPPSPADLPADVIRAGGRLTPTSLCFALLGLVDEQVARALGAERQDQVLRQGRDEGQGQHESPVMLRPQHRFQTSDLQQRRD